MSEIERLRHPAIPEETGTDSTSSNIKIPQPYPPQSEHTGVPLSYDYPQFSQGNIIIQGDYQSSGLLANPPVNYPMQNYPETYAFTSQDPRFYGNYAPEMIYGAPAPSPGTDLHNIPYALNSAPQIMHPVPTVNEQTYLSSEKYPNNPVDSEEMQGKGPYYDPYPYNPREPAPRQGVYYQTEGYPNRTVDAEYRHRDKQYYDPQQYMHPEPAAKQEAFYPTEGYSNNPANFEGMSHNRTEYDQPRYNAYESAEDPQFVLPAQIRTEEDNFKRETPTAYFQETRIECHDRNAGIANNDITMKSESLEASCHNCTNKKVLCAFECNHNCCEECLVFECTMKIYKFIVDYQSDASVMQRRFFYTCPCRECDEKISVPTDMIFVSLNKLLKSPQELFNQEKFMQNGTILQAVAVTKLESWIPYFDGIKHFIFLKSCGAGQNN